MEPAVKSRTWARNRLIRDGIYQAIYDQMKVDPSIYLFGEGSHMKVHFDAPYIEKDFPTRIVTLPICVKGDTLILGDNKPISSVAIGGLAFGGNGRLNAVSAVMKRQFLGDMVSIKARYLQEIMTTPEHPIRVVKRESMKFECGVFRPENKRNVRLEWVPALEIKKGDFLLVPRLRGKSAATALDLTSYRKYQFDSRALGSFPINADTAWLLGLYVAEGCTNLSLPHKEYIQFSLHENELALVKRVKEIFASLGKGYKVGVRRKPGCRGVELHASCAILARAIGVWCGNGALNKQVPDFIMTAERQIKTAFLRGLFDGDGHLFENTKSLHSSSRKLVLQTQLLVASLGGMMGISYKKPADAWLKSENRVIKSKESWLLEGSSPDIAGIFGHSYGKQPQRNYVVNGEFILVPVTAVSKKRYAGDVFNIETTDHTYLVSNAVVHNCEDGNTNFAVGTSLAGIKPIVDVISSDFLFRTMDSISNTAAKLDHVSGGVDQPKTIVIRSEFFFGGPTSGQRQESLFTHIPGLSVVVPSNPRDARGLMKTAITNHGVTIFFEDRMISDADTKQTDTDNGTTEQIGFGRAKLRRQGKGLTIVSYAIALREAEAVVEANGIDCDLIDLRTLYPLDGDSICSSVSKTGRLLIVEPDVTFAGTGAEVAATVAERCVPSLRKPVVRLGAPRTVIPVSMDLHRRMIPSREDILSAIRGLVG